MAAAGISVVDAVLGTTVEVPILDGTVEVTVPPGTQPDSTLRLRGQGLPEFGGEAVGDLMVAVGVHIPEALSDAERQLFEQLRAHRGTG